MIKGLNTSGRYITVQGGAPNAGPYISPGAVGAGMVRYNSNMNQLEVNDGNTWQTLATSYATIELTPETESLLNWAREQRSRQLEREQRIKNNPALKKAYEAILRAEANFDLLEKFVEYDDASDQVQSSP